MYLLPKPKAIYGIQQTLFLASLSAFPQTFTVFGAFAMERRTTCYFSLSFSGESEAEVPLVTTRNVVGWLPKKERTGITELRRFN